MSDDAGLQLTPGDEPTLARGEPPADRPVFHAGPLPAGPKLKPRLVVVEQCCHLPPDAEALGADGRFGRLLASDEQPVIRRSDVGTAWEPLETWWLKGEAGMLHLANVGQGVLLLGMFHVNAGVLTFARVRPGETCRFEPRALEALRLRCTHEGGKASLFLCPL